MTEETPFDAFALVGTVLEGQYRVDDVVGEGGFGIVYRGWHLGLEQPIAIKALKIPAAGDAKLQAGVLAKFHEEAKLCYVLSQRSLNIVRCIGFGELTTPSGIWAPFLVLEWLEGRSLEADLDERRARGMSGRSVSEAIALLEPAARALAYAHSERVAHRDVKPANMFLTTLPGNPPQHTMKVLDFGIAKVITEGATPGSPPAQATAFSSFTPFYAAPEQLDPRLGMTGPWTDVYSLALVLAEVLSDRPANEGDALTLVTRATDPIHRPTPRSSGVAVSDILEAIFSRALAVDPKDRFAEAGTFWDAVVAAARYHPTVDDMATQPMSLADLITPRTVTAPMPIVSRKVRTTTARMPSSALLPAPTTTPQPQVKSPQTSVTAPMPARQVSIPAEVPARVWPTAPANPPIAAPPGPWAPQPTYPARYLAPPAAAPRTSMSKATIGVIVGAVLTVFVVLLVAARVIMGGP